ncbi:hypothetical protein QWT69_03035 [Sporosarcina oncorhynchi]|uniref:Uncharacterized protein n=1 Tax=Sporosarcina oncorhynchi TaxID=3056444 RepID=A0ABZ0L9G8_9BACL|nr:hypothetical protein [Sporosarcina sp. T2O-4]WOV88114.1 hypothetical protein QWT69_03035 [Sporosarcina sp. T2O-4]
MIKKMLGSYIEPAKENVHHRYRSWVHCYNYFKENHAELHTEAVQDVAALHLGFYLASLDMMGERSKLLQVDYRIHLNFIKKVVADPEYHFYYTEEGRKMVKPDGVADLLDLMEVTRECYEPHIKASDTLVTKILSGVFGCIPAYDRYLIRGLTLNDLSSSLTVDSLNVLVEFFKEYEEEFTPFIQHSLPEMRFLDIYFWQCGKWEEEAVARQMQEQSLIEKSLSPVQ